VHRDGFLCANVGAHVEKLAAMGLLFGLEILADLGVVFLEVADGANRNFAS